MIMRRKSGPARVKAGWRRSRVRSGSGITLDVSGPAQPSKGRATWVFALFLFLAITAVAVAEYSTGRGLIPIAWLAVGPLLGSLVLSPRITAVLAGWSILLGLGLMEGAPRQLGGFASHLGVMVLLAAFAVANAVLRTAAQRRLSQVRAVARVAQSALLREVPASVTAGRLASRYVSAAAEARVGGDLLEVISDESHPRWLIGDTRGKGLPAVRLASVAMTSFRDACAQPGLSLPEIARVVDRSVARAAGDEDFVTAVFAELDPRGWLQLVICGHPPPLRLTAEGGLQPLTPRSYATPLGLHPDVQPSTFTMNAGDRLVFFTDGLLEARDRAGRSSLRRGCGSAARTRRGRRRDHRLAANPSAGRVTRYGRSWSVRIDRSQFSYRSPLQPRSDTSKPYTSGDARAWMMSAASRSRIPGRRAPERASERAIRRWPS
jgi:phosphoserine phosphatase RsbU/P